MAARRDRSTPYELMGGGIGRGRQRSQPADVTPTTDRSQARQHADEGSSSHWWSWSGAGMPILLRVPRGMAVLAALGMLGLILLAFWVGLMQAGGAGGTELPSEQANLPQRHVPAELTSQNTAAPRSATARGSGSTPANRQSTPQTAVGGDPRTPGLNYFVLATVYPHADARRLSDFLRTQGVETIVDPINNDRSAVIAVDEGFAGSELSSDARHAYERRLQEAGRAWRREAPEFRDHLDKMYLSRYNGP